MGRILADKGKQVEFLPEGIVTGIKSADLRFDGRTWDVKNVNTNNQRTIRKAYKDATLKAESVIFYDKEGKHKNVIQEAINRERSNLFKRNKRVIRAFYITQDGAKLQEL